MKKKKILAIVMACTLSISMVGASTAVFAVTPDGNSPQSDKVVSPPSNLATESEMRVNFKVVRDETTNEIKKIIVEGEKYSKNGTDPKTEASVLEKCWLHQAIAYTLNKDNIKASPTRKYYGTETSSLFFKDHDNDNANVKDSNKMKAVEKYKNTELIFTGDLKLQQDASWLCADFPFGKITFDKSVDTSEVTNMAHMFEGTKTADIDISNFNTSKVTDMGHMFSYADVSKIDLSKLDVSTVENMECMFYKATGPLKNISNWDVSNVNNLYWMFAFYDNKGGDMDFSGWKFDSKEGRQTSNFLGNAKGGVLTLNDSFASFDVIDPSHFSEIKIPLKLVGVIDVDNGMSNSNDGPPSSDSSQDNNASNRIKVNIIQNSEGTKLPVVELTQDNSEDLSMSNQGVIKEKLVELTGIGNDNNGYTVTSVSGLDTTKVVSAESPKECTINFSVPIDERFKHNTSYTINLKYTVKKATPGQDEGQGGGEVKPGTGSNGGAVKPGIGSGTAVKPDQKPAVKPDQDATEKPDQKPEVKPDNKTDKVMNADNGQHRSDNVKDANDKNKRDGKVKAENDKKTPGTGDESQLPLLAFTIPGAAIALLVLMRRKEQEK